MGTNIRFILRLMKLPAEGEDIIQRHCLSGVDIESGECFGGYVKFPDDPDSVSI
jgi:hypothetical protein